MPLFASNALLSLGIGIAGFALLGFALQALSEGRRFSAQDQRRKRILVALALAQWPYLYLTGAALWDLAAK